MIFKPHLALAITCLGLLFFPAESARADYVNRIYWTDWSHGAVYRANVDGSGTEQIISTPIESLDGLAIDPIDNQLYIGTGTHLLRSNLDGSNLTTVLSGGSAYNFFDVEIDATNRKIYWNEWIQGGGGEVGIKRADLDGTSIETVWHHLGAQSKAIDPEAGKLYWASDTGTAGRIYKSDLDGTNREQILYNTFHQGHLAGLALDLPRNKMYFTTWEGGGIWRANMDGTGVELLLNDKTASIALDSEGGKIYWTSWAYGLNEIKRANLDGTGEEVVCLMGGAGNDIALEFVPEPTTFSLLAIGGLALLRPRHYGCR